MRTGGYAGQEKQTMLTNKHLNWDPLDNEHDEDEPYHWTPARPKK
jgi:hypothetical protein|tara:strand:- start:333 stop:467 length:135 start_codon:yes stop_codon:yes gene_type:complete